ncbi:LOW QUALITY PROTEIN: subtilisin-like protease SBT5.4 [Prosopis cineraria]|uniref:LOW QUALITY PROTEIN: subtilisin-like protease SBT5.4 n=1 Tax=Prosopis cineraria TaxID=364024 RepID=UPI0024106BF0|nr:LOW QUALITY PROTEIN: subtilisin-like protease SBT5.4 [Prosopis cineraria]
MALAKHSIFFFTFILFSFIQAPTFAIRNSYIVYLGSHSHGPEATDADFDRVTESHHQLLGSFLGGYSVAKEAMMYSYTRFINGFAAVMEENVAAESKVRIFAYPKVLKVLESKGRKLHTTRSWEFMLQTDSNGVALRGSTFKRARFGADTIIANIDTGVCVWPESQSFSDEGMGPIPSKWKGACDGDKDPLGFRCNRKLIGARYFNKGYLADPSGAGSPNAVLNQTQIHTPRDYDGHGSHTLSTAGGNSVHRANMFGHLANGTASGGSPLARLATYKVCWPPVLHSGSCHDSDILAAIDMAIHDGVDVISVSLGGFPSTYLGDIFSIGAFHAYKNGVNVVCSTGNDGPSRPFVTNIAPWVFTVAASTIDRDFQARVQLQNGKILVGASLSESLPQDKFYPIIASANARRDNSTINDANLCLEGTIDPKKVEGKILVCMSGVDSSTASRVEKGYEAFRAGAAGMILSDKLDDIEPDMYMLPAANIKYQDTLALLSYLQSTKNPVATIYPPSDVFNLKPSPAVASFSSRGPSSFVPEILKPDITAPGVNILAAYSPAVAPTIFSFDNRSVPYTILSGTSMSCPHVSGVVGLLRTLHPEWSPAAVKSAIMTSAKARDSTGHPMLASDDEAMKKATPFDYGSGHIRPNKAIDPGLVYDSTVKDYLDLMCGLNYTAKDLRLFYDAPCKCPYSYDILNFNYPSVTVPVLYGLVNVTRTLKNVGSPATYVARVLSPPGLAINVQPKNLKFEKLGEEKSFTLTIQVKSHGLDTVFGMLIWSDGKHFVRSPITVGGVKV